MCVGTRPSDPGAVPGPPPGPRTVHFGARYAWCWADLCALNRAPPGGGHSHCSVLSPWRAGPGCQRPSAPRGFVLLLMLLFLPARQTHSSQRFGAWGGHWSLTRVIHARAAGRVAPVCRTPARCGGSTASKTGSGSPCWSQHMWVGGGHKLTGFRETLEKRAAAKTRRGRRVAGAGAEGGGRRGRCGWPGRLPAHPEGGGADGCRCLGAVARGRALPGRALSGAGPRGPQVPRERRGEDR